MKELLRNNANIEATDKNGCTPLFSGIFLNEMFFFNIRSFIYFFLYIASSNGHHEVVKELLRNNANIEATDKNGFTPLFCGIFLNELFIFNIFIIFSFMFIASKMKNLEGVRELLRNKANIEATNKKGDKPLIFGTFLNDLFIIANFERSGLCLYISTMSNIF